MYTRTGQRVVVEQRLEDLRYLVRPVLKTPWDNEEWEGDLEITRDIFEEPPVHLYAAEIVSLKAEIEELIDRKMDLQRQLFSVKQQHKDRMDTYKEYDALKLLDQVLNDKITHYVWFDSYQGLGILPAEQAVDKIGERRLLIMYGKGKKDLRWAMKRDSHRGIWEVSVVPFVSYKDARDELRTRLYAKMDKRTRRELLDVAAQYDIPVPEGYAAKVKAAEAKIALASVRELEGKLATYRAKLDEVQSK